MSSPIAATGPLVERDSIVLRLSDPDEELAGVRLATDRGFPVAAEPFAREGDGWTLRIAGAARSIASSTRSPCSAPTAGTSTWTDPANPLRAPGAFGEKSVVRAAGLRARRRGWAPSASPGATDGLTVASSALGAELQVAIWRPDDARDDEPLPLLVAHDGPELDQLARLTDYARRTSPRARCPATASRSSRPAIATSGTRRARCTPARSPRACCPRSPTRSRCAAPVGAGVSLGALAMLHAQRRFPDAFAGLFLQSGSFFMPRFDAQESGFVRYRRIVRFVRATLREPPRRTVPVAHDRAARWRRTPPTTASWPGRSPRRATRSPCTRAATCTTTRRGATRGTRT